MGLSPRGTVVVVCLLVLMTYAGMTSASPEPRLLPGLRPLRRQISLPNHRLGGGGTRPSQRIILLILRQKCLEWYRAGVRPLPSYCWMLLRGQSSIPRQQLNGYYDHYVATVPRNERELDFQKAEVAASGSDLYRHGPVL